MLEAQVPVQAGRVVLLDDEAALARVGGAGVRRRPRGSGVRCGIALALVLVEPVAGGHPHSVPGGQIGSGCWRFGATAGVADAVLGVARGHARRVVVVGGAGRLRTASMRAGLYRGGRRCRAEFACSGVTCSHCGRARDQRECWRFRVAPQHQLDTTADRDPQHGDCSPGCSHAASRRHARAHGLDLRPGVEPQRAGELDLAVVDTGIDAAADALAALERGGGDRAERRAGPGASSCTAVEPRAYVNFEPRSV